MTAPPEAREQETLRTAGLVQEALRRHGVDAVLIGALALAHHGYVRATEDLDLGVRAPHDVMRAVADELSAAGYEVTLAESDADDPLSGVLTVEGAGFDPVQVVNFEGRFPRLVDEAVARGEKLDETPHSLHVTDLETLVLFKLYAGGLKSAADVLELLARHPRLDLEHLRTRARDVRLDGRLERLLALRDQ